MYTTVDLLPEGKSPAQALLPPGYLVRFANSAWNELLESD